MKFFFYSVYILFNFFYTGKLIIPSLFISKSALCSNSDLYICPCYVIPDESSRQTLTETNIFDRLLDSVFLLKIKLRVIFIY